MLSWDLLLSSEAISLGVGEGGPTLDADHIAREPVLIVLGHELRMLARLAFPCDALVRCLFYLHVSSPLFLPSTKTTATIFGTESYAKGSWLLELRR